MSAQQSLFPAPAASRGGEALPGPVPAPAPKQKRRISDKLTKRIETLEGRPVKEALTELYVNQSLTYRMICKRWKMQPAQLIKLIRHCGIEPRKGSEAVKVQWVGNDQRRLDAAATLGKASRELVAQGRHGRIGKTKENCESIRQMALKKKETTSFRDPVVRQKIITARIQRHLIDPSTHPNAKALPSKREQAMLDHFKAAGYNPQFSYYLAPYWVDVFLPELGIGIECVNSKRPAWERHESLAHQGAHMLYVMNDFIDRGDFRQLDAYIANFQSLSKSPAFNQRIIWLVGEASTCSFSPTNQIIR